ncbi:hypothetical protein CNYM01_05430 [Colletotrichum nymphaeae SA-01]|uniref:Heterokaryon incompatibility domain-containing protein n=1 Tax=Colletotrichum nymphaeae SA-01 TaxID=1460502 RepID=A0A135USU9_9PEZI|nr:hypothetical protein CNYM01_05430 [Colletotrichum nymphaeae SA-01]
MSRWHEINCDLPRVEVEDGIPVCRACYRTAQAVEPTADDVTAGSIPAIPPNQATGMMNLWWPHSVPYRLPPDVVNSHFNKSDKSQEVSEVAESLRVQRRPTGESAEEKRSTPVLQPSPIYPKTIRSEEFRLINFPAAETCDGLVHLDLEVHAFDNCPGYEAVSYTWAGEDDDSALKHPVYVGSHWDILWQTKNCWEMLRFVRPKRGLRMLWVDAICINQANVAERNGQVANMARIYSECIRCVVYLGPDIAIRPDEDYPRRRRLHELEMGLTVPKFPAHSTVPQPMLRLKAILGRKYFSRVWVVQELLLSHHAVIRIGDVDFWIDPIGASYFSMKASSWKWEKTSAPWAQHLTQGQPMSKDLTELLLLTSKSHSTDPRDRVFGVFGILPTSREYSTRRYVGTPLLSENGLKADYSLSANQVFIGTFAYSLLVLKKLEVLYQACGLTGRARDYPSWAPDWRYKDWSAIFSPPRTVGRLKHICEIISRESPTYQVKSTAFESLGSGIDWIEANKPWHQGAFVNSATGALNPIGNSKTDFALVASCPYAFIGQPGHLDSSEKRHGPSSSGWNLLKVLQSSLFDSLRRLQEICLENIVDSYDHGGEVRRRLLPHARFYRDLVPLYLRLVADDQPGVTRSETTAEFYLRWLTDRYVPRVEGESVIFKFSMREWIRSHEVTGNAPDSRTQQAVDWYLSTFRLEWNGSKVVPENYQNPWEFRVAGQGWKPALMT